MELKPSLKVALLALSYLAVAALGYFAHPVQRDTGDAVLIMERSVHATILSRLYLQMQAGALDEAKGSTASYLAINLALLEEMKPKSEPAGRGQIEKTVQSIARGLRSTDFAAFLSKEDPFIYHALPPEFRAP